MSRCCCFACCPCFKKKDYLSDINNTTLLLPKNEYSKDKFFDEGKIYVFGKIHDSFANTNFAVSQYSKSPLKKVVCGIDHGLFLFNDGNLFGVGNNTYGQLGQEIKKDGNTYSSLTLLKVQLEGFKDKKLDILDIAAGNSFSLILVKPQGSEQNYVIKFGITDKARYADAYAELETTVN